mmetsp:Transcript_27273/g.55709  ORF Transcript_27273/g.55709 Transcript_27273/m.55709 type:complete len:366 (-) Transcript_27273:697-1794(-)
MLPFPRRAAMLRLLPRVVQRDGGRGEHARRNRKHVLVHLDVKAAAAQHRVVAHVRLRAEQPVDELPSVLRLLAGVIDHACGLLGVHLQLAVPDCHLGVLQAVEGFPRPAARVHEHRITVQRDPVALLEVGTHGRRRADRGHECLNLYPAGVIRRGVVGGGAVVHVGVAGGAVGVGGDALRRESVEECAHLRQGLLTQRVALVEGCKGLIDRSPPNEIALGPPVPLLGRFAHLAQEGLGVRGEEGDVVNRHGPRRLGALHKRKPPHRLRQPRGLALLLGLLRAALLLVREGDFEPHVLEEVVHLFELLLAAGSEGASVEGWVLCYQLVQPHVFVECPSPRIEGENQTIRRKLDILVESAVKMADGR